MCDKEFQQINTADVSVTGLVDPRYLQVRRKDGQGMTEVKAMITAANGAEVTGRQL